MIENICAKHLQWRIISLKEDISVHTTGLNPSLFIEIPVPRQESER